MRQHFAEKRCETRKQLMQLCYIFGKAASVRCNRRAAKMNQDDHTDAVRFLKATHDTLARQTDLSPDNGQVDALLGRLVAMLKGWHAAGFGHDLPSVPS